MLLMMTHLQVLGQCVRYHLLTEVVLGPADIEVPLA